MKIKHTISIDLDSLVRYSAHKEMLKEHDVKFLMGGELYNHNEIELDVETEVDRYPEEATTPTDPGCPAWAELTNTACVEDYAFSKTMELVDDCTDPVQKLRIFQVMSREISYKYQEWVDCEMESVALEQVTEEAISRAADYADFLHDQRKEGVL